MTARQGHPISKLRDDRLARAMGFFAGLSGFAAVLLAALGAHAVDPADADAARRLQTATVLHLPHAAALLALAMASARWRGWAWRLAGLGFALGQVLFCGSLYLLAFGAAAGSPLAPLGGGGFMAGWLACVWMAARAGSNGDDG